MHGVNFCVCYEKPQEVPQFCKEAMGMKSCLWLSMCLSRAFRFTFILSVVACYYIYAVASSNCSGI